MIFELWNVKEEKSQFIRCFISESEETALKFAKKQNNNQTLCLPVIAGGLMSKILREEK